MFFEVKLKDGRGATNKKRISTFDFDTPSLNEKNKEMLNRFFLKQYKKEFCYDLRPSIMVHYKRFTLVSLAGGERMTVDYL